MDMIDENLAQYIWGFFLDFDEDRESSTYWTRKEDRSLDFGSIRSLRCVNKFFRNAFDDVSGWSKCGLAIHREYNLLENDASSKTWELPTLVHPARQTLTPRPRPAPSRNNATTKTLRNRTGVPMTAAKMVSMAMERQKKIARRKDRLLKLLELGPFTHTTGRKRLCPCP